MVRFPGSRYAVISQTLAGFQYHQVMEAVGSEGAIRGWWSGALDRTLAPTFALAVKRRGHPEPETIPIERSGEVFELHDQLARTVAAFEARRALVSGVEARKRVIVCVEAERSLREGREMPLVF
jgi:myo-inositol 2-dehydrogenase/D-chiro-inositol 1-dehydrogenase